eukprot:535062-Rhodomonas_salina.1
MVPRWGQQRSSIPVRHTLTNSTPLGSICTPECLHLVRDLEWSRDRSQLFASPPLELTFRSWFYSEVGDMQLHPFIPNEETSIVFTEEGAEGWFLRLIFTCTGNTRAQSAESLIAAASMASPRRSSPS